MIDDEDYEAAVGLKVFICDTTTKGTVATPLALMAVKALLDIATMADVEKRAAALYKRCLERSH